MGVLLGALGFLGLGELVWKGEGEVFGVFVGVEEDFFGVASSSMLT